MGPTSLGWPVLGTYLTVQRSPSPTSPDGRPTLLGSHLCRTGDCRESLRSLVRRTFRATGVRLGLWAITALSILAAAIQEASDRRLGSKGRLQDEARSCVRLQEDSEERDPEVEANVMVLIELAEQYEGMPVSEGGARRCG
jgi:hypothetical protein